MNSDCSSDGKKKRKRRKAKQGQTFPFISTAHLERERLSRKCIVMFTLCSSKGPKRQWRRRLIRSHGGLQESQDVQYHWTSVRDHFDHHRGVGQSLDGILTTLVTFRCRAVWNSSRPLVNVCFPSPSPGSLIGNRTLFACTHSNCAHVCFNQTPANMPYRKNATIMLCFQGPGAFPIFIFFSSNPKVSAMSKLFFTYFIV